MPKSKILVGNILDRIRELPDESIHMVVTSPPYWNLRNYAVDGQIGLEETPQEYLEKMLRVFQEVRRVLRSDGLAFVYMGDSYAGSWGNQGRKEERGLQRPINGKMMHHVHDGRYPAVGSGTGSLKRVPGLKPKDLVGMPWRLALALQDDGWYLRSDIIWFKPNPVTSSVTTGWQPTCHCDHVTEFKPGDFDAIKSPTGEGGGEDPSLTVGRAGMDRPRGENEGNRIITRYQQRAYARQLRQSPHRAEMREQAGKTAFAHYLRSDKSGARPIPQDLLDRWIAEGWVTLVDMPVRTPYPVAPAVVLDPFSGAGTTCMVANRLGRDAIGGELNPEYAEMSVRRISGDNPMFNQVELV